MAETDPKTVQDLTSVVQTLLQQMQGQFQTMSDQITGRIDDMSSRTDDLEKNVTDLMTQAGMEELEDWRQPHFPEKSPLTAVLGATSNQCLQMTSLLKEQS
ncbi:Heat shock factor-binding protein 1 [Plecturocebus cupreus]